MFLAPHNDDEALFGAFTIMRERPQVVIVTDSYIQYLRGDGITAEQRKLETKKAMEKLGVKVHFLGIPDDKFTKEILINKLKSVPESLKNTKMVFTPMIEGGNRIHDMVGEVAHEMFDNVLHYSTYTKTRPYSMGDIEIRPTQKERDLKNEVLEEYHTQKNHKHNKIYFEHARNKSEYFNSSRFAGKLTSLKEQALIRNII